MVRPPQVAASLQGINSREESSVEPSPSLVDEVCCRHGNVSSSSDGNIFKQPLRVWLADDPEANDPIISEVAIEVDKR